MLWDLDIETVCAKVVGMDKAEVKDHILHFDGPLRLDFTEDYLDGQDIDQLRHILLAAMITVRRKHAATV